MKKVTYFLIFLAIFFIKATFSSAERCKDYLLLDGSEPIVRFGLDTTDNWWAITQPFEGRFRMTVNGEQTDYFQRIYTPVFSPDGYDWSFFGEDFTSWKLIMNDTTINLDCTKPGDICYSPSSEFFLYSYFVGDVETLHWNNDEITVFNRVSNYFLSHRGNKYSYVARVGNGNDFVIFINGTQSRIFRKITPIGFWYDGSMIYAAYNGATWQIFKNFEPITEDYAIISEVAINLAGDCMAYLVGLQNGYQTGVMISEEYTEPLQGRLFDGVSGLALHPHIPIITYNAFDRDKFIVVMNNTIYDAGLESTSPVFSHDGSEMMFIGCDVDCFVVINGRRLSTLTQFDLGTRYAIKPNSNTIAFSTNSTMLVRDITSKDMWAGMMVDYLDAPRFNWRRNTYEALGIIRDRLYLLTCE